MALSERAKRNWEKMKEQNAQRWEEEDPTPAQNERKQQTTQAAQQKTIVKPNAKSVSTGKRGQAVMVTDAGAKAVQREREVAAARQKAIDDAKAAAESRWAAGEKGRKTIMKQGKSVSSGKPGEAVMVADTGTGDAVAERTARRDRYQAEYDKAYAELYQKNHSSRIGGRGKRVYRKAGGKDAAQIDALQDKVDSLQTKMDTIDLLNEYDDKVYKGNFGGIVGANYDVGDLGQKQAQAAYDLMQDPYDADKQAYLNAVNTVTENFVAQNQDALNREIGNITSDDTWVGWKWLLGEADTDSKFLKNWASNAARALADTGNANIQYLPQLKYQVIESIIPTFIGLVVGGLAGNPTQGARIGYSLGTASYSYETMAGAAYQSLLELGADPETAKRLASDEAFLSSLIEGADTYADLALFGGKAAGKAIGKAFGKTAGKAAAKKAAKKATGGALKALGGYLVNAAQEGWEEGTQEAVSIYNENRFLDGYTGEGDNAFQRGWNLFTGAGGTYIDAMKGALPWWEENENTERILEASKAGVQVALGMGALGMATSNLTNTVLDNTVNADTRYEMAAEIASEEQKAAKAAEKAEKKAARKNRNQTQTTQQNVQEGTAQQAQSLNDVTGTVVDPEEIRARQAFTDSQQKTQTSTVQQQEAPFRQLTEQEQQEMWQSMGLTDEQKQWVRERWPYGTYTQEELENFLQSREAMDRLLRSFDRLEQRTAQETQEQQTGIPGDITTQQEIVQQTAPVQEIQQNPEVAAQMQQTEDPGDVALRRLAAEMDQRQQAEDAARAQREMEDFEAAQTAIYQQQNQQRWSRSRETVEQAGSGLAESSTTDKWSRKDVAAVNKMAQQLGAKVYTANARELGGGNAEGSITGNVILLDENATATEAVRRIYGHEIGHRIKDLAPEEFNVYVDAVREVMPDFDEKVELKQALLAANHRDSSVNAATEEVAADYAGRLMSDGDTMEQFIQQNQHRPSLLKTLAEAFRELWRKLTGKERTQAEEAAYRLEKAYEKAVEAQRKAEKKNTAQTGGGDVRYSTNKNFTRFSLKQPVEESGDLVAVHNVGEDALLKSLDLGGLPMPSIAVVKAADGHSKYGSVSLVFNKSTIDPQTDSRNRVYGADAWTPTSPRVDYQVNSNVASAFEREIHSLSGNTSVAGGIFGNSSVLRSMGVDDTSTMSVSELAKKLSNTDTVRAAYLADQGKTLDAVKKNKVWDSHGNDTLQKVIDRIGVQELAEIVANLEVGESVESALGDSAEVVRDVLREYYKKRAEPFTRKMAVKNHWTAAEINEKLKTKIDRSMQNVTLFTLDDIVRNAWAMYEDGGVSKGEIDRFATSDALRSAVNDNEVKQWVEQKLSGVLGEAGIYNGKDPYTASGNSRSFAQLHYAYTLENIVKAMQTTQDERGEGVSGASAKSLQATVSPEYGSIQDIRNDRGRLMMESDDAYQTRLQAVDDKIGEIVTRVKASNKAHSDNPFIESDIIGESLLEASKGKKTVDAIIKTFRKNGYQISNQIATDIQSVFKTVRELPTGYFEAKPQRAVGFNEVLAAIVPDNSSSHLLDALEQAGVPMMEYEAGNETDRLAKLNSVENSRFSLRTDAELEAAVREIQQKRESGEISAEEARKQISEITQKAAELNPDFQELKKDNKELLQQVKELERQMTITPEHTARQADTDRVANGLLRDFSSKAERSKIKQDVHELASSLLVHIAGGDVTEIWDEFTRSAESIMREVIENAEVLDDTFAEEYKDIKQYLKSTPLVISETDSHDITDFAALKKSMRGTMRISVGENGNIDRVFADMADRWPGLFNTETTTHPADIVERIADVMDMLKPAFENPFDANMEAAVQEGANMLLETLVSDAVREAVPTFADKQAAELVRQKAKYKAKISKLLERKRKERAVAVSEAKKEGKRALQARQKRTETRAKIKRHTQAMSTKLLNPTDTKHVPSGLKSAVAKLLESINLDSERDSKNREQRVAALAKLKSEYQKILLNNDGDIVVNPDLLGDDSKGFVGLFDRVIAMGDKSIYKMTQSELDTVWAVVRSMETAISNAGKALANQKSQTIRAMTDSFAQDVSQKRPKPQTVTNALRQDMMNPYSFFHQFGETASSIWRELRDAQDTQTIRIQEIAEKVQSKISPQLMKQAQKTVHTFKLENGKEITLTNAQIMNLYNLMQRQQAQDHLMKGGVVQPEVKVGKTKVSRGTEMIPLTLRDLLQITDVLSTDEKAAAEALQALTGDMAVWGNEASERAYGYQKFTEANYWPIQSAQEALHSTVEKGQNNTRAIKNIGMAKNTVPHASTALDIGDIFDVFSRHTADMIDYSTWLLPMEDVNRFFNHKYVDENGVRTGQTVKGMMERIGGKGSQAYWMRLMEDIQNGINPTADTQSEKLVNKIVGNAKGAAVGANIRVILQQPTAFARAYAVMNPMTAMHGIFSRGVTGGNGWKKAQKYSGIGLIKAIGGFDQGNARSVKQQLFGDDSFMGKVNEISGAGAEAADAITWGWLWNASEWQAKRENPNLKPGSEAFYQKTADIFTDVIEQTQVVDGILQRTQIMRSGNSTNKQATAFMGEPLTTLNLLTRSWDEMRYSADKTERKQARGKLARSLFVVAFTSVVNAAVQSVPDAFRDDDKENDWWDRFLNAMLGFTSEDEGFLNKSWKFVIYGNTGSNLNPAGWIPYVKDVLSMIQGYGVDRADADVISDVVKNVQDLWSVSQGDSAKQPIYVAKRLLTSVATALGIPVKSLTRDIWSVVLTGFEAAGQWETVYELTKVLYKPGHAGNKSRYISLLYRAKKENPEDYNKIRKDILDNGYFESTGKTAQKQTPAERRKDAAKKIENGVKKLEEEAKEREESRKK